MAACSNIFSEVGGIDGEGCTGGREGEASKGNISSGGVCVREREKDLTTMSRRGGKEGERRQ